MNKIFNGYWMGYRPNGNIISGTPGYINKVTLLIFLLAVIWMANAGDTSAKVLRSNTNPTPSNTVNNTLKETNTNTSVTIKTPSQLPASTNAPQSNIALTETTIKNELETLIAIDEETSELLKKQDNPTWTVRIDKAMDSSLAATLAGLALAAAAFLLSLAQRTSEEIENNKKLRNEIIRLENQDTLQKLEIAKLKGITVEPGALQSYEVGKTDAEIENRLTKTKSATRCMIHSFFGFLAVLIASLTIDTQTDGGNGWTPQFGLDFASSVSAMAYGISWMLAGAIVLFIMVPKPEKEAMTDGNGES